MSVVQKYLAGLSADALAAKRSRSPLGTSIPFYKRLLASRPSLEIDNVAFELDLPISFDMSIKEIIRLRKAEMPAFQRFQHALRIAIAERLKTSGSTSAKELAQEIKRDVINPELRRIRDLLATSRTQSTKSAAVGLGLGVTAASIGLLTPLSSNPIGTGLIVGGAVTLGMSSIKKSIDDYLSAKKGCLYLICTFCGRHISTRLSCKSFACPTQRAATVLTVGTRRGFWAFFWLWVFLRFEGESTLPPQLTQTVGQLIR